jgi:hypothetical protein
MNNLENQYYKGASLSSSIKQSNSNVTKHTHNSEHSLSGNHGDISVSKEINTVVKREFEKLKRAQ